MKSKSNRPHTTQFNCCNKLKINKWSLLLIQYIINFRSSIKFIHGIKRIQYSNQNTKLVYQLTWSCAWNVEKRKYIESPTVTSNKSTRQKNSNQIPKQSNNQTINQPNKQPIKQTKEKKTKQLTKSHWSWKKIEKVTIADPDTDPNQIPTSFQICWCRKCIAKLAWLPKIWRGERLQLKTFFWQCEKLHVQLYKSFILVVFFCFLVPNVLGHNNAK